MLGYLGAVTCDPKAQLASQLISTFLVAPFMFWLAFQPVPPTVRLAAMGIGAVSLVVDGWQLIQRVRES